MDLMKVYISGIISMGGVLPVTEVMTNVARFRDAGDKLRAMGHDPVNPVEQRGLREATKPGHDAWISLMRSCIVDVTMCDAICLLPGWEKSKGARIEERIASDLGLARIELPPDQPTIKYTSKNGYDLTRGYSDDAGLDLYTSEDVEILPGKWADVPTGVAVELPPTHWAMIAGRSSAIRKKGVLVVQGIIDTGFRGELYVLAMNVSDEPVKVYGGERLGQLIPFSNEGPRFLLDKVDNLGDSERGHNGFGSTG